MKILVVGIRWPAETFLERLLEGLHQTGNEITIVPDKISNKKKACRFRWIHPAALRFIPLKKWDVLYFPWNEPAIENKHLFRKHNASVISCRGSSVKITPYNPEENESRQGLAQSLKMAKKVHCVSEDLKHEITQYGLDSTKISVIRPAIDPHFFCPPEGIRASNEVGVFSTAGLNWKKGFEYALLAMKKLKQNKIKFRFKIAGDGPERKRILYTIRDLELEEEVELLGCLPPERVRRELQRADIFLLSSLSEGISNAVLEAMGCGLPVVTTDAGGMREAVADGVEGYVVPRQNIDAIAEKLQLLAENTELRNKMGGAARRRILKDFNLRKQIEDFMELFKEACA